MDGIENAKIGRTFLGKEDHGILTTMLNLEGPSWGQGFGGWTLRPQDGNAMADYVDQTLKTVGVSSWEELNGQLVRVKRERGLIVAIGHITEDRWFTPKEDVEAFAATT